MRRYAAEVNNVFRRVRVEDYGTVELIYTYSMNGDINGRGVGDAAIVGVNGEGGWTRNSRLTHRYLPGLDLPWMLDR